MDELEPSDYKEELVIQLFNEKSNKIASVFGINVRREKWLDGFIRQSYIEHNTVTDTMQAISEEVEHANELAYSCFHVGTLHARLQTDPELAVSLDRERRKFQDKTAKKEEEESTEDLDFSETKKEEDDLVFDD